MQPQAGYRAVSFMKPLSLLSIDVLASGLIRNYEEQLRKPPRLLLHNPAKPILDPE
jgi:hypothetical protein